MHGLRCASLGWTLSRLLKSQDNAVVGASYFLEQRSIQDRLIDSLYMDRWIPGYRTFSSLLGKIGKPLSTLVGWA